MEKSEMVKEIAKQTGIRGSQVKIIIESFMDSVMGHVTNEEHIALSTFGSFKLKKRAAKMGRNISK